ncbi:MAG: flagellar brake protein [Burkholderiales bacterium]
MTTAIDEPSPQQAAAPVTTPAPDGKSPCQFRDMRLKVGDRVQIAPPEQIGAGRLSATVVGWVEGKSLILTIPQTPAGRLCLHAGEYVVVRAFTGRSAFAFSCTVLRSTVKPCDYLHLSFPDRIDGVGVRSSPRFRLGLPARVKLAQGSEAIQVTIDNIGSTGALLVCDRPLGATGDSVEVAFDVVLHDVPVSLALRAQIKTADQAADAAHYRHGVFFVEPSTNDRLILAALVWFNMYENPKLSA